MSVVRISIRGTHPMLQHSERLANPLDPYTRELKLLTGKRKKTDDDLARVMQIEARAGAYETPDHLIGLPDCNLWRSIQEAARATKRGKDIDRGLLYDPERVVPLLVDGESVAVDEFLARPGAIDYRSVGVQRNRVMRSRPSIAAGWESSHEFELLEDVLDLEDIKSFAERAGRLIGVCDHRPQYGRFEILSIQKVS